MQTEMKHSTEAYTALLIVGPPRSGKTFRAIEEARKLGGIYVHTDWETVKTPEGLGSIMELKPSVVIVEGVDLSPRAVSPLKSLVCGEPLLVRKKYGVLGTVPAPAFIFTALVSPPIKLFPEAPALQQRFRIIELTKVHTDTI